jgi:acetyltransferase-like isoleucine patch superfamily enzyme
MTAAAFNDRFLGRDELESIGVRCGGDDIAVHFSTVIISPGNLRIGNHVRVDPFCVISATGSIVVGDHIHIGSHCSLIGAGGLTLSDFSGLSHGARLFSASDDPLGPNLVGPSVPSALRHVRCAPVRLERHALVGANSVVLPGVTLHEGAVVGAASHMRKDAPAWTIWVGVPARRVGVRDRGVLESEQRLT